MKKLLIVMILGLCLSFGYIGQANAVPTMPWGINQGINFVTDNSAEYLLNWDGSGTTASDYTTDNGDTLLQVGDLLRGMFVVDQISYGTTNQELKAQGIEFTGVFELEVASMSKVGTTTGPTSGNTYDLYDYVFKPSSKFENEFGIGAIVAMYIDDTLDYNRLYSPDDSPGAVSEEATIDTAESPDLYWTFGFTNGTASDGEGWNAYGAPEDVVFFTEFGSQGGGSANLALNLLTNPLGPQLAREIVSPYGGQVDFAATAAFIGIQNQTTAMDLFDNFDGELKPVPEPATMLLLGTGLIALAGLGRKKFFKKG